MKNYFRLLTLAVLGLLFGSAVFAQTEKQILEIRNEVNLINKSAKKYTKKTRNVEGISLEGTEATYFVSGRGLKKITARMYGETFNATGEFYYNGEELIFAFIKHNKYDTQIGMNPPPKVVRSEEQRFYFAGGELIRILVGKKEIKPADERYNALKEEIIGISTSLKEAYN